MMSETITIRDDEGGQVTDKPEETEPPTAAARTDSEEVLVGGLSPDRTKSPESCSICLGKLENKSFTDSCFHTFCFTCLQEWSKVKAVCPLCKQDFKSIIHNVRSIEDYDQYDLRSNNDDGADDNRFRYRTTLTPDRWMQRQRREQSRQLRMLERPSAIGTRAQWHRMRQTATSDFRRQVYTNGDRVQDFPQTPGRPRRERNISPEFLRQNPACSHRLVPWLNRELNVLLHNHEDHVQFVLELIIDLITKFEIGDEVFRTHLDSFLGRRTDHFVHEFIHFARSPYDMCTYDARAVYQVNTDSVDPSTVLSVDSSSNSDVNNDDSDIIVLSPTEDGQSGGDHSYYSRGFNNEPLAERRDAGNIASTPTPLIERVRDFLASVDLADTAHSGWESPLPGPSTLDWSPPNPASPTLEAKEQQSAAEESDDIQEIKATPATVVPVIEQGAEMNQSNNASDDDVEVMITAFDKPYLERSPSPIDISSEEDLDVLIAIANSKRTKIEDDNRRNKSKARRSRTPAQYRIKSKSRSRSHSRRRSRSRNSSRSYSRRRSRSRSRHRSSWSRERSRYERGKRRQRSRSIERRSRSSRSRSRGRYDYGRRSRSGSRNNDRYGGSRGSKYDRRSRSMSPRRWRRSVSSSRSYRHEGATTRWRRSRSSSIEYIGWKGGKDRHDGRRGDKRRDRRENRKRRRSGDSIEILERSSRGDSSRRRNRSHSRSRRSDRDDASYKKHPSGHKKSSNVTNKTNKEESIPLPVPVNMIKLEPVSWQIDGPFPVLFTESNDNLCVAGDASNSTVADSSVTTGAAKNSVSAAEHKASTQSDCTQQSSERDKQASLNTTIEISQTSLMKTTIGGTQLSSLENVCQKSSGSRKDSQNSSSARKDSYNSSNSRKDSHSLSSSRNDRHSSSSSRKDGHSSSSSRKNSHNSSSSRKNGHNSSSSRKDNQNSSSGSTRHKQNSSTKGEHKLPCLTKDGQGSSGSSKGELKSAKDGQQTSNYAKDGQRPSNSSEYRKTSSSSVKNAQGSSTPKKDGQASRGSLTKSGQSSGQSSSSSSRKDSFQSTLSSTGGLKISSSKSSTCETDSKRFVAKEGAQQLLLVSGGKTAEVQKAVKPCEDIGNLDRSQSGSAASVNTAPCNSDGMGLETCCHSLGELGKSRMCGCDNNSCELHLNQASTNLDLFSSVLTGAVDLNQLEKQMREKLTNRLKSGNDGHCMDSL